MGKGGDRMKLLNYDSRELILQNMRCPTPKAPATSTKSQHDILCNLIRQKHITKQFFEVLIVELYETKDWRKLTYNQMYELIHILTFLDYQKVRM